MLSRTYLRTVRWAPLASYNLRSSLHHQITSPAFQSSARLAYSSTSSKPGETVGGTKTDHTKEFDQPSQSQKSGEQHTQQPGDTVKKGGSSQGAGTSSGTQTSGSKAGGAGDSQQESGQHVGPMGSG